MPGPFDFLHIKGRTAGSSNELSFDVLEAASSDINTQGKSQRATKSGVGPSPKQGSYHGVAGSSTLSATPEVARRKRTRRNRSIRTGIIAFVIIAALASVGAYAGMRFYQERVDFSGRFAVLINDFIEVDKTLARADELMTDALNFAEAAEREKLLEKTSDLASSLDAISSEAFDMKSSAASDKDRAALEQVQLAADARIKMLNAVEGAFSFSKSVNSQVKQGNDAWNTVLAADEVAREATSIANAAKTEEETLRAREKTEEAIVGLEGARADLTNLKKVANGINLDVELAYINKRLEALAAAVRTSDALLANDRSAAMTANGVYNRVDAEAAELAGSLQESIAEKIRTLHAEDAERYHESYLQARSDATTADSAIRAYL